jgi:hypothetical protein
MFGSILNGKQHDSLLLPEAEHELCFLKIRLFGDARCRSVCRPGEVIPNLSPGDMKTTLFASGPFQKEGWFAVVPQQPSTGTQQAAQLEFLCCRL